jgi:heptosyltransferase II
VVLLGSPSDRAIGDAIVSSTASQGRMFNWCGATSLDEAIAIISLCSKVVSNDSGLMHIAAALHVPQVAVFGSSDPNHTPPNSKSHHHLPAFAVQPLPSTRVPARPFKLFKSD